LAQRRRLLLGPADEILFVKLRGATRHDRSPLREI
jgi:hypothetical protein